MRGSRAVIVRAMNPPSDMPIMPTRWRSTSGRSNSASGPFVIRMASAPAKLTPLARSFLSSCSLTSSGIDEPYRPLPDGTHRLRSPAPPPRESWPYNCRRRRRAQPPAIRYFPAARSPAARAASHFSGQGTGRKRPFWEVTGTKQIVSGDRVFADLLQARLLAMYCLPRDYEFRPH
jgi:hypothetical protein